MTSQFQLPSGRAKSRRRCHPTFCSSIFYQQKEFMNIENFYALRKIEWQAYREHAAAIKIQTCFRRWLMRENFKLVNRAATKIQAGIRGFLARERVERMREELEEERQQSLENEAAAKIQAAFRGHLTRSQIFNYKDFKSIRDKNAALARSVATINDLESLLQSGANSSSGIAKDDRAQSIVERLLSAETTIEDILRLSPSRVASILEEIESLNEDCLNKGLRPRGMTVELAAKIRHETARRAKEDALDRLFPKIPSIPGLIQPKADQVERLRKAIGSLRCTLDANDEEILAKKHHLLRTYQRPGVLSDVTTHRLTEEEENLKKLKFWEMPQIIFGAQKKRLHTQCAEVGAKTPKESVTLFPPTPPQEMME